MLNAEQENDYDYGDGGYDDLRGALALAQELMILDMDGDEESLQYLLDNMLTDYSTGGICQQMWAENPKSLAAYEEEEEVQ
jgi:hypothetical protein